MNKIKILIISQISFALFIMSCNSSTPPNVPLLTYTPRPVTTEPPQSKVTNKQVEMAFFSAVELMTLPERKQIFTWWQPFGKTQIKWLEKDIYQIEFVSGLADNKGQIEQWLFYLESKAVKPLNGGSLMTATVLFCNKDDPKPSCQSYSKEIDRLKQELLHITPPQITSKPTKSEHIRRTTTSEKRELVAFVKEVSPLIARYEQLGNEWNNWHDNASQIELQRNLISKARHMDNELSKLHDRLLKLAAPQEWANFKDLFSSAIAKTIEYFSYAQEYALSRNETYRIRADAATLEAKKLYSLAADEWDKVIAQYKL